MSLGFAPGYSGFRSELLVISGNRSIRTEPDFPDLILTSGFRNNAFTVFKIQGNSLVFLHSIGSPKYYKEGNFMGSAGIDAGNILK